jgi:hypothetical protein
MSKQPPAQEPGAWSLNVDELAIYLDGKRFAGLDEGHSNDLWREALLAGSEIVRLLNVAHGITGSKK